MSTAPFLPFTRPSIDERTIEDVADVLRSGWLTTGPRCQALEAALSERWGGRPGTVFIGDLNTYPRQVPPGWPELNLVLDAGFHTTQDLDECAMPTSNTNCPDWIFVSPDQDVSSVSIVVDRPDHRPITATVTPGVASGP